MRALNQTFWLSVVLVAAACGTAYDTTSESTSKLGVRREALVPSTGPVADPTRYCTRCHGGLDNATGAPPRDLARNSSTTFMSIGAHTAHVTPGPLAGAFGCGQCHPNPGVMCTPNHLNGDVELTFGTIANARGVTSSFDLATGSCTTYCHGAAMQGGTRTTPIWNSVGTGQVACGSCHGIPPVMPSARHPTVAPGTRCRTCHPQTMTTDAQGRDILLPNGGLHLNGTVEGSGHPPGWYVPGSWYGGAHGANTYNGLGSLTMDQYYVECTPCHGNGVEFTMSGGPSGRSCGACHPAFFVTSPTMTPLCSWSGLTRTPCTSCTFCHQ